MTRSELLERMSSAELTEWIAFYRVRGEPAVSPVDSKIAKIFARPAGGG
jgi:hypothetical protein